MLTKSICQELNMEIRKLLNESSFYKIESIQQISKDDLLLKDYKQIFDDLVESEIIKIALLTKIYGLFMILYHN